MRIWILKASEPTPYDSAVRGSRLFRYGMLAQRAVEVGHEVLWWTDDFDHFHKEHRFGEDRQVEIFGGAGAVQFVFTPGYRRNASLQRFRDHAFLARRIESMADAETRPDIILAGMPSDRLCVAAIRLGARYGVPVALDVRDLWPDVFFDQVPATVRPLLWLATRSMESRVRWAFSRADAIIGNTEPFVRWGLAKAGRDWSPWDRVVPIGYRRPCLSESQRIDARAFWREYAISPDDNVFTICFFGSIGPMYDFIPILEAAQILLRDRLPVRFVLCGKGPGLERLRKRAKELDNVVIPGWVNKEQIWALMEMCSLGIAPYRDSPNFRYNLPNKPAEYLSASLPFLVSIDGIMHDLVRKYGCGQRYRSGSELAEKIRSYRDAPGVLMCERANAERVFSESLDAKAVYSGLIEHFEALIGSHDVVDAISSVAAPSAMESRVRNGLG